MSESCFGKTDFLKLRRSKRKASKIARERIKKIFQSKRESLYHKNGFFSRLNKEFVHVDDIKGFNLKPLKFKPDANGVNFTSGSGVKMK